MKNIINTLKQDANAFKQSPPNSAHEHIMHGIQIEQFAKNQAAHKTKQGTRQDSSRSLLSKLTNYSYWILPTGLSAASLLIVLNMQTQDIKKELESENMQPQITVVQLDLETLSINSLSVALESNLVAKIKTEKQALKNDLEYMKNLFIL